MKDPIFTGCGTAIVTPFTEDGVDLPALGRLLDFQLENGADAIVACGTTGEASTMSRRERSQVIEYCAKRVDGRVPVIAGSGSNSTQIALELSKEAEAAGADGLLLVTPYYNKASQEGLVRHFSAVADAAEKPCLLYNVPSRTGVSIAPETYARLARHGNIQGVKEAGGDLSALQRTRNLCPEDFYIWSGSDEDTVAVCALGGVGVISVAANILPAELHTLVRLCLDNDFAAAGKLQLYIKDLCDALFCEVNPIPVKAALNLLGWQVGEPRLPLCPPEAKHLDEIRKTLERYALLPIDG